MEEVAFKPFDGEDGLKLDGQTLSAWRDGEQVASAQVAKGSDLPALIDSGAAAEIIDDVCFFDGEGLTELVVQIAFSGVMPGAEVYGPISVNDGEPMMWRAEPGGSGDWKVVLPPVLSGHESELIRLRAESAVLSLVSLLGGGGRDIPIPYRRVVSNRVGRGF